MFGQPDIPDDPKTINTANLKFYIHCVQADLAARDMITDPAFASILNLTIGPEEKTQIQSTNELRNWLTQANQELANRPDKESAQLEITYKKPK